MTIEPSFVSISIRGRYFWRGDERFFVRGVVYQPKDNPQHDIVKDPIADDHLSELKQNVVLLIDFLALPNYGWAGVKSNMQISGWNAFIDRYEKFAIPAFLSEYGVNTYQPRQFHETKALYSDPMTRVFSGGCVYEFTDNANNFGLAAMPGADEEWWFQKFRGNQKKVIEVRQTDQGNLYIYHDFASYKAALAEPTDYDPSWDIMERQAAERHNTATTQMTWPWDPEYQMPATCIDWDNIEELVERWQEIGSDHIS
ncbi:glycolipid anchored surface protein GAS1, partial [Aureobasidium melanogenum]